MDLVNQMQSMSLNIAEDPECSSFRVYGCKLNGHHTDIAFAEFKDKFMILASQYEKIGQLLKVTVEHPNEPLLGEINPVYTITTVFGSTSIEQEAAARYFAEQLQIKDTLLIFLSLKDYSSDTIKQLLESFKYFMNKEKEA